MACLRHLMLREFDPLAITALEKGGIPILLASAQLYALGSRPGKISSKTIV
jgi:hypothetical protein